MHQDGLNPNMPEISSSIADCASQGSHAFGQMTEEQFKTKFNHNGEQIHAQLDLWRSAYHHHFQQMTSGATSSVTSVMTTTSRQSTTSTSSEHRSLQKEDSFDIMNVLKMLESKDEREYQTYTQSPSTSMVLSPPPPPPPPPYPYEMMTSPHQAQTQIQSPTRTESMEEVDEGKYIFLFYRNLNLIYFSSFRIGLAFSYFY